MTGDSKTATTYALASVAAGAISSATLAYLYRSLSPGKTGIFRHPVSAAMLGGASALAWVWLAYREAKQPQ